MILSILDVINVILIVFYITKKNLGIFQVCRTDGVGSDWFVYGWAHQNWLGRRGVCSELLGWLWHSHILAWVECGGDPLNCNHPRIDTVHVQSSMHVCWLFIIITSLACGRLGTPRPHSPILFHYLGLLIDYCDWYKCWLFRCIRVNCIIYTAQIFTVSFLGEFSIISK